MILWRLHGYSDPEGELTRSEVVCSIEHGSTMQADELYPSATAAQEKAEALRAQLLKQGWTAA